MTDATTEPLRILLVEDEPMIRILFRAVLTRSTSDLVKSADVIEAGTLADGRSQALNQAIDIAIIDVGLPDGSGLDLVRELNGRPDNRRPVLVIVSASVLPRERQAASSAGAHAFLAKPYQPDELLALLTSLVADRERRIDVPSGD